MFLECNNCNKIWDYFGKSKDFVVCPDCNYKIGINNIEINNKLKIDWYVFFRSLIKENYIECEICYYRKAIEVHHIDKNRANSSYYNLKLVCKQCHLVEHNKRKYKKITSLIKPYFS